MTTRQRPDRFDGDAHPGADGDVCPLCGYTAPAGEMSRDYTCSSCGGTWTPSRRLGPWIPDQRQGATTWL